MVLDDDATPEQYRAAMSALHVGETIKITGSNRHPRADGLLVDNVDLKGAHIVDIGASDGSTSVDLIRRIPEFGRYTMADLFFHLDSERVGRHDLFYGPDGDLILIVGSRAVAWPSLSPLVSRLYRPVSRKAGRPGANRTPVLLLNPEARRIIASDERVQYQVHDIFTPWAGVRPDVIKVANLLRRLYFPDDQISIALTHLLDSLPEGGHLLMVDNPRIAGIAERGGLYRREGGRFVAVAESDEEPEIADLIGLVSTSS